MFGAEKYRRWLQRPVLEKKDSKPPDYGPLADAAKRAAQYAYAIGQDQLAFAKQQYADALPLFRNIVDNQVNIQNATFRQGQEDRQYLIDTYRPLERSMVADAEKFNTDAYREQLASKAAADAGLAFSNTQDATARAMAAMGVNPNSGRFAGMANQNALALAAARANAMTNTRQQAENVGYARKLDAAGLGRNLVGASQGAYALSMNAGNSAGQNQMAPGSQYMSGLSSAAQTGLAGANTQVNGLSNIVNSQTSMYNTNTQANAEMTGAVVGGVIGMI